VRFLESSKTLRFFSAFCLALGLMVSGCGLFVGQDRLECANDGDCPSGHVCDDRKCEPGLASGVDGGRAEDSGMAPDAGDTVDAGIPVDAGPPLDAGALVDASADPAPDASLAPDSGPLADGGNSVADDAGQGSAFDAATPLDSGGGATAMDASIGPVDAGSGLDAGQMADAAGAEDGGGASGSDGGPFQCTPDVTLPPGVLTRGPGLGIRSAASPFSGGVSFRLARDVDSCQRGSVIQVPVGSEVVSGTGFYEAIDGNQGTIALWLALDEWPNGQAVEERVILKSGDLRIYINAAGDTLIAEMGGATGSHPIGSYDWSPDQWHFVALSWNAHRPVVGANHIRITVDDVQYSSTFQPSLPALDTQLFIGGDDAQGNNSLHGRVAGFTIFRRVLSESASPANVGTDLGQGNEYELGRAYSELREPTSLAGSWDVTFALPTDGRLQGLRNGDSAAWRHPFSKNRLGPEGYAIKSTGWTNGGVSLADANLADTIFAGGVTMTLNGTPDLIYRTFTVPDGAALVIRALVTASGANAYPRLELRENGGSYTTYAAIQGNANTSVDHPDELILTYQTPTLNAGDQTYRVDIGESNATSGNVTVHQVEVFVNLLENPSMETGDLDGGVPSDYAPVGWIAEGNPSGSMSPETSVPRTGIASLRLDTTSITPSNYHFVRQAVLDENGDTLSGDGFFMFGGYFKWETGHTPTIFAGNAKFAQEIDAFDKFRVYGKAEMGWKQTRAISRRFPEGRDSYNDYVRWGCAAFPCPATIMTLDDAYAIALDSANFTVVPLQVSESLEASNLLVRDGDRVIQDVVLTSNSVGNMTAFVQRLNDGALGEVGCTDGSEVLTLWGNQANHIIIASEADSLVFKGAFDNDPRVGGMGYFELSSTDGGNPLDDDAVHQIDVYWDMSADRYVSVQVDGQPYMSIFESSAGTPFHNNAIPNEVRFGSADFQGRRCDLRIELTGATVENQ
jgi:hypothetical protein